MVLMIYPFSLCHSYSKSSVSLSSSLSTPPPLSPLPISPNSYSPPLDPLFHLPSSLHDSPRLLFPSFYFVFRTLPYPLSPLPLSLSTSPFPPPPNLPP